MASKNLMDLDVQSLGSFIQNFVIFLAGLLPFSDPLESLLCIILVCFVVSFLYYMFSLVFFIFPI